MCQTDFLLSGIGSARYFDVSAGNRIGKNLIELADAYRASDRPDILTYRQEIGSAKI